MSSATADDQAATSPPGGAVSAVSIADANDQWSLVWKTFRRNRPAVLGVALISLLVTAAVFAPFLANGKPLWYRGYNRFQYQDAYRTLNYLTTRWGVPQADNAAVPPTESSPAEGAGSATLDIPTVMRLQVGIMRESLSTELGTQLQQKVEEFVDQPLSERAAGSVAMKKLMRETYDPRKIQYVTRTLSPVIHSLVWWEIFCMTAVVVLFLMPVWNRFLPRERSLRGISPAARWRLGILVGLPLLASFSWWYAVPERLDRTPYSRGVPVSADPAQLQSAPFVYETVVRAPIPYDLDANDLDRKHAPPSWEHLLGTDAVGRDVMSRMIWGGRVSLSVGLVAVSINVIIGVIVGAVAGYFRGVWDLVISRIIEIVICFPSFFLILTIVAFMGPSIFNIMIVLGLIGWTGVAQLVRGEFLRLGEQEFILAARALGFSPLRIIFLHVLPNAMAPVLVSATFGVAGAILTESALSFLGLGITVPRPSWGGILASGREAIRLAPWLIYFPGLVIFVTITSYNLVGETLRDAADPRMRGRR